MDTDEDLYGDFTAGEEVGDARPNGSLNEAAERTEGYPSTSEAALRDKLAVAQTQLAEWQTAFTGPDFEDLWPAGVPDPTAAAHELARLRSSGVQLKASAENAERRAATAQVAMAERMLENVELRRTLAAAGEASAPHVLQLRQLLLEPALAREYNTLRRTLEERSSEAKRLREELQAVTFSQESKAGRMLMAKCRALQEENEEMGRELSEGRVGGLERQLAVARDYVSSLRRAYAQLEDHAEQLDEEAEQLQQQVLLLQRQLSERERGRGGPGHGIKGGPLPLPPPPEAWGKRRADVGAAGHYERSKRMR